MSSYLSAFVRNAVKTVVKFDIEHMVLRNRINLFSSGVYLYPRNTFAKLQIASGLIAGRPLMFQ
jgi:hypothetical protein